MFGLGHQTLSIIVASTILHIPRTNEVHLADLPIKSLEMFDFLALWECVYMYSLEANVLSKLGHFDNIAIDKMLWALQNEYKYVALRSLSFLWPIEI